MSLDEGCDLLAEGEDVAGGRDAWSEIFAPVARAENGFDSSPIVNSSVDFGADDAFFGTDPTAGSLTQTATFSYISYKFFKAAIHAYLPDNGEGPWEDPPPIAAANDIVEAQVITRQMRRHS